MVDWIYDDGVWKDRAAAQLSLLYQDLKLELSRGTCAAVVKNHQQQWCPEHVAVQNEMQPNRGKLQLTSGLVVARGNGLVLRALMLLWLLTNAVFCFFRRWHGAV